MLRFSSCSLDRANDKSVKLAQIILSRAVHFLVCKILSKRFLPLSVDAPVSARYKSALCVDSNPITLDNREMLFQRASSGGKDKISSRRTRD